MAEEEEWDWDADNFDPEAGFQKKDDDRWEGEDVELDPEALKAPEEPKPKEVKAKDRKNKDERIAEKKAKRREEELLKEGKGLEEGEAKQELSAEEQLAEKVHLQQVQKESDLQVAKELFGVPSSASSLDSMQPVSKEDFSAFEDALATKITHFETSPHYTGLLAGLVPKIATGLDVEDLRKLSSQLSLIASEKQKAKAPPKQKKKGKVLHGTGKAQKKTDVFDMEDDYGYGGGNDDFDFM